MPDLQGIKKSKNKGKKKNPGPQDFKKQKVKVGRKLVKKNETSTTIKSRKLNLQKQSVAVDRTGKEVNSRGLTLVEILAHSTHYNANMRKDCLAGVRDFFELHPKLLSLHVGAVLEKVSDLLIDQDAVVRKEFRALSRLLLRRCEPAAMAPHLRMFVAHICGGMSHVHESIRAAALALLDDMVPLFPRTAALFGHKLLPIFLHILGGGEDCSSMTGGASAATGAVVWARMSGSSRGPRLKTMGLEERLAIIRSLHALMCAITRLCYPHTEAAAVAARNSEAMRRYSDTEEGAGSRDAGKVDGIGSDGRREGGLEQTARSRPVAGLCGAREPLKWVDSKRMNLRLGHGDAGYSDNGADGCGVMWGGGVLPSAAGIGGGCGGGGGGGGGGDAGQVELALGGFLVETLPLLVQAWAEAYQAIADHSLASAATAQTSSAAARTMTELVYVLHLSMAIVGEMSRPNKSRVGAAGEDDFIAKYHSLAAGVCRAVMQYFPLDAEQVAAASGPDVARLNKGILLLVTAALRTCIAVPQSVMRERADGSMNKAGKERAEMLLIEERLCGYLAGEMRRAHEIMGAAAPSTKACGVKQSVGEVKKAAAASSAAVGELVEVLTTLLDGRAAGGRLGTGCGGQPGGWEGVLMAVFTKCWLASKTSSSCKKAGVRFIGQRLERWRPAFCDDGCPVIEWVRALAKLVWTLQDRDTGLSQECLGILTGVCRREHPDVRAHSQVSYPLALHRQHVIAAAAASEPPSTSLVAALQPLLVPFFRRTLPGGGHEAGPFFALGPAGQQSALALLYYMAPLSEALLSAFAAALVLPEVGEDIMKRGLEMMASLADARVQSVHSVLSFFITVALSAADGEEEEEDDGGDEDDDDDDREGAGEDEKSGGGDGSVADQDAGVDLEILRRPVGLPGAQESRNDAMDVDRAQGTTGPSVGVATDARGRGARVAWVAGEKKGMRVLEMVMGQMSALQVAPVMHRLLRPWLLSQWYASTELSSQGTSTMISHHLRALLLLSCAGANCDVASAEWRGKATLDQRLAWGSCGLLLRSISLSRVRNVRGDEDTRDDAKWPECDAEIVGRVAMVHGSVLHDVITRLAAVCVGDPTSGGGGEAGHEAGGDWASFGSRFRPADGAEALEVLLANRSVRRVLAQGGKTMCALTGALAKLQAHACCREGEKEGWHAGGGNVCSSPPDGRMAVAHGKITARVLDSLQRQCDVLVAVVGVQ